MKGGPDVGPGDLVVVLEWDQSLDLPCPHTGVVQRRSSGGARVWHPDGVRSWASGDPFGWWADSWRLPTPEELTAYQLSQLAGGGL